MELSNRLVWILLAAVCAPFGISFLYSAVRENGRFSGLDVLLGASLLTAGLAGALLAIGRNSPRRNGRMLIR